MQSTQSFYLNPGNLDLIVVSGPDAVKLLQGQLTCDVQALDPGSFTRGAACNNKGRIYATFVLVRQADAYFLIFNRGVGSIFAAALRKFLPFYKCSMQLAPPEWQCLAAAGPPAIEALTPAIGAMPPTGNCAALPQGWICRLGDDQVLLATGLADHATLQQALSAAVPGAGPEAWQLHEMLAGHFPFTAEDVEKYTPQELQLDTHGYVSFSKGCYTGQEIVARMHYRGKVKKQLYLLSSTATHADLPLADQQIHDAQGSPVATPLKQFVTDTGARYALAPLSVELASQPFVPQDANRQPLSMRVF